LRREVGNPLGRHVDRSVYAWLIRRFIDAEPEFGREPA
jgi:hypothetical protein